jgi:malate synthase
MARPRGWHLNEKHVLIDGKQALSGSPTIQVVEDTGKKFTTQGEKPYFAAVEEAQGAYRLMWVKRP